MFSDFPLSPENRPVLFPNVLPALQPMALGSSPVAQMVKNLPAMQKPSLIPGWDAGEGNDNTLQYSCLEKSMDRGAWQAIVHVVAKSQT